MFSRYYTMIIALTVLAMPAIYGQEKVKIDWHKVKVDCNRTRTKSKSGGNRRNSGSNTEEKREHITVMTNIKNSMKEALTGLQFHAYIIVETVGTSRRNRKIQKGDDKLTKDITVEPNKKVTFQAIKSTVVEKNEYRARWNNRTQSYDSNNLRVSGVNYEGYVGLLTDSEGNLLMVKAENTKVKKMAQELGIVPKDIEMDRYGVVSARK